MISPIVASSTGSGPSSAASGIPWTFPLVVVAGVFMSPCASTQISPIRLQCCLACPALAAIEPAARLWSPTRTSGTEPASSDTRVV